MSPAAGDLQSMRRILLALDSSLPSRAALEEAVRLARHLDAELTALFIEDINLINFAELPFARHILLSGAVEPVDMAVMESLLRSRAAQAQRAIKAAALNAGLRWSFRIARGRIAEQVLAAAADQDLLLIGWTAQSGDQPRYASLNIRRRPSAPTTSTVRVIAGTRLPVLLLRDGDILNHPVAVVFDGGEGSKRALDTAAALAVLAHQKLVVLIAGARTLADQAAAVLEGRIPAGSVEYRVLPAATVSAVCAAQAQSGSGIVVLDVESPLLADQSGNPLAAFSCPVLLAR